MVEDFKGTTVGRLQGLLYTVAADEHMGAGLKVGVNKGMRCLMTSWQGLLVGKKIEEGGGAD